MPETDKERPDVRALGLTVAGWIAAAVLVAALVVGIWYFLRGSKEKRSPEIPQQVSEAFAYSGIAQSQS